MIRVLVVDDSLFMRTVIRDMIGRDPDCEVVGVAVNGRDALTKIGELKPDVMTLDIEMPELDGIGVLRTRKTVSQFPKTLMLSSLTAEGAEMTRLAMSLGANDFMLKPKEIASVRGIERELIEKIKNLVSIRERLRILQKPRDTLADKVVLIGSSAGGPPMLDTVISNLPDTVNAAVVITQHMPEGGFTAALAARLDRISPLPVQETNTGDLLRPGQVYVSKAGVHTVITATLNADGSRGGKIIHSSSPPVHSVRPAVDKTFASAAMVFGSRIVSAILSGMGNDGGQGTLAIKRQGGMTFVCREEDCLVYGMARSALDLHCVDKVLPLKEIPGEIMTAIGTMGG